MDQMRLKDSGLQPLGSEILVTRPEGWLSVKCLSRKHKDLSSDPQHCCKNPGMTAHVGNLSAGGREWRETALQRSLVSD